MIQFRLLSNYSSELDAQIKDWQIKNPVLPETEKKRNCRYCEKFREPSSFSAEKGQKQAHTQIFTLIFKRFYGRFFIRRHGNIPGESSCFVCNAESNDAIARLYGESVLEMPNDLYIPPEALEVFLDAFEGRWIFCFTLSGNRISTSSTFQWRS